MNPDGSFALTDSGGATVTLDAEAGEIRDRGRERQLDPMSSSGITLKDASGNEIATAASGITVKAPATSRSRARRSRSAAPAASR